MSYVYVNDAFVSSAEAKISVADRGFRYGDGVFETIAVHSGKPYQLAFHIARLKAGLEAICIPFNTVQLPPLVNEIIKRNQLQDGLVRIAVSRGSGSMGYLPLKDAVPTLVIETLPFPATPKEPITLWKSTYEKTSPRALPAGHKLAQGLNSTLARMEADAHAAFDALVLNAAGEICETSSANIFFEAAGKIYTPSLAIGALNGSTRAALLRLQPGIEEGEYPLSVLQQASAVAICNAAWKVLPVAALAPQNWQWQSETFAARLNALIAADIATS